MYPVIPEEMLAGAIQVIVCFVAVIAALASFMLARRA
jgi:hypothetical protein